MCHISAGNATVFGKKETLSSDSVHSRAINAATNVFIIVRIQERLIQDIGLTHVNRIHIVHRDKNIDGVGMSVEPMDAQSGAAAIEIIEEYVFV